MGPSRSAAPPRKAATSGPTPSPASGLTGGNYDIAYVDGALTIDPARLTVTADDARRSYGAANPAFSADIEGFVLGQEVDDLGGALVLGTAATQGSDVGTYAISGSGLTSGNYDIAYVDGALTIDPARLVVTPGGTRTYGSLATDFDTEITGFVLGQDVATSTARSAIETRRDPRQRRRRLYDLDRLRPDGAATTTSPTPTAP